MGEVYPKVKYSKYFGVRHNELRQTWIAHRWSKCEKKTVYNGSYKDAKTAAHASDTLARQLIANGEKGHKLNFPYDDTKVCSELTAKNQTNKRKRPANFDKFQ